jgi:hypothetical protein
MDRQAIVDAPVLRHADRAQVPAEESESETAELAFEGIDVEKFEKFFTDAHGGHPPDELARAVWAFYTGQSNLSPRTR